MGLVKYLLHLAGRKQHVAIVQVREHVAVGRQLGAVVVVGR